MPLGLNPTLVEFRELSFGYGEQALLKSTSFCIPRGKVTALIGPMGAGKTSALRLMGGEHRAWSGQMLFDGEDIGPMDQAQLYAVRRRMGVLFQFAALFADISVFDNVAFPLREHTDLPEALIRNIVLMKLNAVGLRNARDLMPSEVSGGMAKRIGIARAIALDPEFLMYDEPFTGLDPISVMVVAGLIRQLNDTMGLTSVFASHEIKQTLKIADHVLILDQGKLVFQGSVAQAYQSTDPLVYQYINQRPDGPVRFNHPAVGIEQDFGWQPGQKDKATAPA